MAIRLAHAQADRIAWEVVTGRPGALAKLEQALVIAGAADNARFLAAHPEIAARKARVAAMSADERRAEIARLDGTLAREGRVLTSTELELRQELAAAIE